LAVRQCFSIVARFVVRRQAGARKRSHTVFSASSGKRAVDWHARAGQENVSQESINCPECPIRRFAGGGTLPTACPASSEFPYLALSEDVKQRHCAPLEGMLEVAPK